MHPLLARCKPGASRAAQLFTAASIWSAVGVMLLIRSRGFFHGPPWPQAAGLLLGLAKSRLALDRSARKTVERIGQLPEGSCLGAIYSWKTWALVLLMVAMGLTIRLSGASGPLPAMLYAAVGTALLYSSRLAWRAWRRMA